MFQSFVLLVGFSKILNSLLFIQLSYIENARLLRGGTTIVFIKEVYRESFDPLFEDLINHTRMICHIIGMYESLF